MKTIFTYPKTRILILLVLVISFSTNKLQAKIELGSFDLTLNNNCVGLNWITATEWNNDYFTVERSNDGINFEPLILIDGAGNSNAPINYSAVDDRPLNGISYYRLKLIDFNGEIQYSKMKAINYISEYEFSAAVFPNPTSGDKINLSVKGTEGETVLVVLTNLEGKQYYSENILINNSVFTLHENLPAGIYLVTAKNNGVLIKKKIVVQ